MSPPCHPASLTSSGGPQYSPWRKGHSSAPPEESHSLPGSLQPGNNKYFLPKFKNNPMTTFGSGRWGRHHLRPPHPMPFFWSKGSSVATRWHVGPRKAFKVKEAGGWCTGRDAARLLQRSGGQHLCLSILRKMAGRADLKVLLHYQSRVPPQGLCTCGFLCLECFSVWHLWTSVPHLLQVFAHLLNETSSARYFKNNPLGTSLEVQWLRIRLAMQGTWARSLVREPRFCMLQSN